MFQKSIAQEFEFISLNENSYSKPKPFDTFVCKEGKKKLTSAKKFIAVDKKEKKAMKKKAKGHNMLNRDCFDSYYPQILDFIASRVK